MLVLVATIAAIASPLLAGGQMTRLAYIHLRYWWLLLVALLAQIVIIDVVPDQNRALLVAIHLTTYAMAGIFVVANWRIPGLLLIALGGSSNGITIALNGGTLPASSHALQAAGFDIAPSQFMNSGVLAHPTFAWLGDIFVWPAPLPLANVFSVGDVLIVLGALYGAHKITGSKLVRHPWVPTDESVRSSTSDGADGTPSGGGEAPSPVQAAPSEVESSAAG